METSDAIPLALRIGSATIAYVGYIDKMIWPHNLAVLYPFPKVILFWKAVWAFLLFGIMTTVTILYVKRHPFLSVGWWWYVGTLVPVIGLVQVGRQAMVDRYTYIPLIGLFIIITWAFPTIKFVMACSEKSPRILRSGQTAKPYPNGPGTQNGVRPERYE